MTWGCTDIADVSFISSLMAISTMSDMFFAICTACPLAMSCSAPVALKRENPPTTIRGISTRRLPPNVSLNPSVFFFFICCYLPVA